MRLAGLALFVALVLSSGHAWSQGVPLGGEFRVNTYTTGYQGGGSLAPDPSGNFVVVWHSVDQVGGSLEVFGQRYDASGTPLGAEFRVNTTTTSDQYSPAVAADPSGNFVVVWGGYVFDGSQSEIFGQRYSASGTPLGAEFRVNTSATSLQRNAVVAVDSSGNFVVAWQSYQHDGDNCGIFGQRYDASGTPLGPEFRVNSYTTSGQTRPRIAADSSGNFVVVWHSYAQDGDEGGIFGQRYASSGLPVGSEFLVNTYTDGLQYTSAVAAEPSGAFVVVWDSDAQDGDFAGVFGQRYDGSGAPLGPEFRVNTYTTSSQVRPSVAADSSGNFVVVWISDTQDGEAGGIFGQRYASSGTPLGPEFRVNTYTTSVQSYPSVAADPSGDFVVVWGSYTQDGSSWGVFGQRYAAITPVELIRFSVE